MMGAGIAYVSAKAGFDVVLKDVTIEAAQKGKGYSEKLEAKAARARPYHRGEVRGAAGPHPPRRPIPPTSGASTS